jgi:hypothetical protein
MKNEKQEVVREHFFCVSLAPVLLFRVIRAIACLRAFFFFWQAKSEYKTTTEKKNRQQLDLSEKSFFLSPSRPDFNSRAPLREEKKSTEKKLCKHQGMFASLRTTA